VLPCLGRLPNSILLLVPEILWVTESSLPASGPKDLHLNEATIICYRASLVFLYKVKWPRFYSHTLIDSIIGFIVPSLTRVEESSHDLPTWMCLPMRSPGGDKPAVHVEFEVEPL
jgi:hypothetical protein